MNARRSIRFALAVLFALSALALPHAASAQRWNAPDPEEGPPGTQVTITGNLIDCYASGPGELSSSWGFPTEVAYYWNPEVDVVPTDTAGLQKVASYAFGPAGWSMSFTVPAGPPGTHTGLLVFDPQCNYKSLDANGNEVEDRKPAMFAMSFRVTGEESCPLADVGRSPGEATPVATIAEAAEDTRILRAAGAVEPGGANATLGPGDLLQSPGGGELRWASGETVRLSPGTEISIPVASSVGSPDAEVGLNLIAGVASFAGGGAGGESLSARAGAAVARPRGTDWVLAYDESTRTSTVGVTSGEVEVSSADATAVPVMVGAGGQIEVSSGRIGEVEPLDPDLAAGRTPAGAGGTPTGASAGEPNGGPSPLLIVLALVVPLAGALVVGSILKAVAQASAARTGGSWTPTHAVAHPGLGLWPAPDPALAPWSTVAQGLEVRVVERAGDWARVAFSNGTEGWLDARALAPASRGPVGAPPRRSAAQVVALVGVSLAIGGSFLPWLSSGGRTASAWQIPVVSLFTNAGTSVALRTGVVLLLGAALALPCVMRPRIPAWVGLTAGSIIANVAALGIGLSVLGTPRPDPGAGMLLGYAGGLLIAGAPMMSILARRGREAARA